MSKRFLVRINPEIQDANIITIGANLKQLFTGLELDTSGFIYIKYRDLVKAGISTDVDLMYLFEWENEPMYPFVKQELEILAEN